MKTRISRRNFLRTSMVGAALPWAIPRPGAAPPATTAARPGGTSSPTADSAGLTAYQVGPQIWIRWNNLLATSCRAHSTQKYPYLYPVTGPVTGLSLTSETGLPWPHHRSLFFGCDGVNGGDYWAGELSTGQIRSTDLKLGSVTNDSVEILDTCEWLRPGQPPVMKDQRRICFTIASPRLRFIDWQIQWTALQDLAIPKTNHSLFSLRAATDVTPAGGGNLVNADGLRGEKATFGKPSAWCDFHNQRGTADTVEGIALFDHPKNPWAPCPWFTRDYGFLSPTPLNFLGKPWELAAGRSVLLQYGVALHAGDPADADLDAVFKDWVTQSR